MSGIGDFGEESRIPARRVPAPITLYANRRGSFATLAATFGSSRAAVAYLKGT
jgi:hypothetical protein